MTFSVPCALPLFLGKGREGTGGACWKSEFTKRKWWRIQFSESCDQITCWRFSLCQGDKVILGLLPLNYSSSLPTCKMWLTASSSFIKLFDIFGNEIHYMKAFLGVCLARVFLLSVQRFALCVLGGVNSSLTNLRLN